MTEMLEFFRRTGKQGGKIAAANMTAEQRSERARKAVAAREAKRKEKALAGPISRKRAAPRAKRAAANGAKKKGA